MSPNVACDEFYIEPDIQEIEKVSYTKRVRFQRARLVNLVDEVLRNSVSVLEAEMGFGKSKTARRLAQFYCSADRFNQSKVVSVHWSFRLFHDKDYTLEKLVDERLAQMSQVLTKQNYQVLVILDGLDEAATDGTWRETLKQLIRDAKADQRVRLLLTTRPLRVLDEEDIFAGVRRFLLRPLSVSKVVQFIQRACENIAVPKKIYEDLQRSDLFKQLPQSPIAAALLSSLISQNQHDLPSNLTELYSKSVEYMLGRWDVQKGIAPEKEFQAAERVCMQLAEFMVSNKLIWISIGEAKQIVTDWHNRRNIGVSLDSLMARVFDKSGLFAVDDDSGTISFRHRSFGEYLFARGARNNNKPIEPKDAFNPYWVNCSFFYIGLLGDCPNIIEQLFTHQSLDEGETWTKVLAVPDYVLAGYQTEYAIVENYLYRLFVEAAELYHRIRRGDTRTKLTELSEMHLLWFFQRLIRHSYDYEFLRPAIAATILKIDQEAEDQITKLYALFFAACFAAQLRDPSGFEYIVKNYPIDQLPIPISLAIRLETDQKKNFSKLPLIKTHDKRLRKLLMSPERASAVRQRSNAATDNHLSELFERPLKSRSLPATAVN